jgi:ribA/ribD-fused uncharacterized protein
MTAVIRGFRPPYEWASNFCQAPVLYKGIMWPDNEHAFQWSKTFDPAHRDLIRLAQTARDAKRRGRQAPLRPDWDQVKKIIMFELVLAKFCQHPHLADRLIATGDAELIEDNTWNDTYWGMCRDQGHNYLGRILMMTRDLLRAD